MQTKVIHSVTDFYLELSKVEQAWQLEGAPFVEIYPRTEKVKGECSRHRAEELGQKIKQRF